MHDRRAASRSFAGWSARSGVQGRRRHGRAGLPEGAIDLPSIATVGNDAYETTGEAASLACAIDRLEGPCVLSCEDILFRRHLLDALLAAEETW